MQMCGSKRYPYPHQGWSLEISRGCGISLAIFPEWKYEANQEIPGGRGWGGGGGTNHSSTEVVTFNMLPSTKRPNEQNKRTFLILGMKALISSTSETYKPCETGLQVLDMDQLSQKTAHYGMLSNKMTFYLQLNTQTAYWTIRNTFCFWIKAFTCIIEGQSIPSLLTRSTLHQHLDRHLPQHSLKLNWKLVDSW